MVLYHSKNHNSESPSNQIQRLPEKYNLLDFSFFERIGQSGILLIEFSYLDVIQISTESKNLPKNHYHCDCEYNENKNRNYGR